MNSSPSFLQEVKEATVTWKTMKLNNCDAVIGGRVGADVWVIKTFLAGEKKGRDM